MKRPLIAGNWKMHKTVPEAVDLVQTLKAGLHKMTHTEVVVCPPFTALERVSKVLEGSSIQLGAQNMHPEVEGPFTGEISPVMLKDIGCRYVILGHSERRQYFHETDQEVNAKLKSALRFSLIPIVCVGETLQEREEKQHHAVVRSQLETALQDLTPEELVKVIIAYEPVWAIGTGRTATPEQAEQMHSYIRRLLNERYGEEQGAKVLILYGGSVKPENSAALLEKPNVDGALVGGASLKAEAFIQIVEQAENVYLDKVKS